VLAIPDEKDHRVKFADWMELKAIATGRVGFGTLVSAAVLTEDEQNEDIADQDAEEDGLVESVQEEIKRRHGSVGDGYPFRIDGKGQSLNFLTPLTETGVIYLFCLYLTHFADHTIIKKADAPRVTNKTRDLFQACSTVAAGGYVRGPAISFGWPRPDASGFLAALKAVYKEFGEGKPHQRPRAGASTRAKDNGVDIIAWRRQHDRLGGTHYLIGQVASGDNWRDKSVKGVSDHLHSFWFSEPPGSQATDAIFIPFSLEPEMACDSTPYDEVLKGYVAGLNYQFGDVFYRDRIARNFGEGLCIKNSGETHLQRCDDLPKIARWVKSYSKRLQTA
jgi:hypothetical protein